MGNMVRDSSARLLRKRTCQRDKQRCCTRDAPVVAPRTGTESQANETTHAFSKQRTCCVSSSPASGSSSVATAATSSAKRPFSRADSVPDTSKKMVAEVPRRKPQGAGSQGACHCGTGSGGAGGDGSACGSGGSNEGCERAFIKKIYDMY